MLQDLIKKYAIGKEIDAKYVDEFVALGATVKHDPSTTTYCASAYGYTAGDEIIMPDGSVYYVAVFDDEYFITCEHCGASVLTNGDKEFCDACGWEL